MITDHGKYTEGCCANCREDGNEFEGFCCCKSYLTEKEKGKFVKWAEVKKKLSREESL